MIATRFRLLSSVRRYTLTPLEVKPYSDLMIPPEYTTTDSTTDAVELQEDSIDPAEKCFVEVDDAWIGEFDIIQETLPSNQSVS